MILSSRLYRPRTSFTLSARFSPRARLYSRVPLSSVNLRLEGHADERGTREYNLALGENRALSVKEVLGLYNLDDRIIVVSYGEESPILTGSNEEAWEKNRRVEFSYY